MNLSNEVLMKGISAFIDAITDSIVEQVVAKQSEQLALLTLKVKELEEREPGLTMEAVEEKIEARLDEYDPSDYRHFASSVEDVVEKMGDGTPISRQIRQFINDHVSVSIDVD